MDEAQGRCSICQQEYDIYEEPTTVLDCLRCGPRAYHPECIDKFKRAVKRERVTGGFPCPAGYRDSEETINLCPGVIEKTHCRLRKRRPNKEQANLGHKAPNPIRNLKLDKEDKKHDKQLERERKLLKAAQKREKKAAMMAAATGWTPDGAQSSSEAEDSPEGHGASPQASPPTSAKPFVCDEPPIVDSDDEDEACDPSACDPSKKKKKKKHKKKKVDGADSIPQDELAPLPAWMRELVPSAGAGGGSTFEKPVVSPPQPEELPLQDLSIQDLKDLSVQDVQRLSLEQQLALAQEMSLQQELEDQRATEARLALQQQQQAIQPQMLQESQWQLLQPAQQLQPALQNSPPRSRFAPTLTTPPRPTAPSPALCYNPPRAAVPYMPLLPKILAEMASMGFTRERARRAAEATKGVSTDAAVQWALENPEPPETGPGGFSQLGQLTEMGFRIEDARAALSKSNGDLATASEYLLNRSIFS